MTGPLSQATCPQCGSPSVQAVPIEKKELGQAIIAEYFLETAASAGSATVIQAMCLSCGRQWFPGTAQERSIRALSGQLGEAAKRAEEHRVSRQEREQAEKESRRFKLFVGTLGVLVVVVVAAMVMMERNEAPTLAAHRLRLACDPVFVKGLKKQLAEAEKWPGSHYQLRELKEQLDTVVSYGQLSERGG